MSKKLGKLKTFELLDTLNWEFIKEHIVLNQSLEEKDEEIKPILDCIKKDQRITELEKENAELKAKLENIIVPKFKVGQKCYCILGEHIHPIKIKAYISNKALYCKNGSRHKTISIKNIYLTHLEAEEALKKLENK